MNKPAKPEEKKNRVKEDRKEMPECYESTIVDKVIY